MSDEILSPAPSSSGVGGISIGSLYGEVSLRHDRLDRDAAAVKAAVAGVAEQLGSLGGVPVASGLGGQLRQVAGTLAPVMAGVSALGASLGGLTLDASGISGGADKAVSALGRVQVAAAKSAAIRLPGVKLGAGALTAAQRNALAAEQARVGGDAPGRLQVERDRALDEMRARQASASEIASAKAGYDARIKAAQASDAARHQAAAARQQALESRRSAGGEQRLANIDTSLQARIDGGAGLSGDAGAALAERRRRLEAQYGAAMGRIDRAGVVAPGGLDNPGVAQARALAAKALSAGQSAANASYTKGMDAQGLQALGVSLDGLKAKRDAFLSGWRANGEDARTYVADLGGLYTQVSHAAAATPGQMAEQARLLKEIGSAAKDATSQVRAVPEAAREAQAAVGEIVGDSVERSLAESQAGAGAGGGSGSGSGYGYERRRKRPSFSQAMRRNWNEEMERAFDAEIGQVAQRGTTGVFGNVFRMAQSGGSVRGSSVGADGSKSRPFYTLPALGGSALSGNSVAQSNGAGQQPLEAMAGGDSSGGMSPQMLGGSGLGASAAQAAPWIAASVAISKALGGQKTFGGRLFSGGLLNAFWKKDPLHFAVGGAVPDEGGGKSGGDTVPAMLTPGEFVLSRPMLAQIAGMSGPNYRENAAPSGQSAGMGAEGVNVTVHQHGDNHFHTDADMDEFSQRQAWGIKNQLQTSAPGLF